MKDYSVRSAVVEDATSIATIDRAARDEGWTARGFRETLQSDQVVAWVVHRRDETNTVVAFSLFSVVASEAELLVVAVAPMHQRQGLASLVLEVAFDNLRKRGVQKTFLEHRRSNTAALRLYSRLGFVQIGQRISYYSDGEDAVLQVLSHSV